MKDSNVCMGVNNLEPGIDIVLNICVLIILQVLSLLELNFDMSAGQEHRNASVLDEALSDVKKKIPRITWLRNSWFPIVMYDRQFLSLKGLH